MAHMVVTAGIDVSKRWLDVALWPKPGAVRVGRIAAGYDELAALAQATRGPARRPGSLRRLRDRMVDRCASRRKASKWSASTPCASVRFAEAKGRLAKNDRADARTIAQATAVLLEEPRPEPPATISTL